MCAELEAARAFHESVGLNNVLQNGDRQRRPLARLKASAPGVTSIHRAQCYCQFVQYHKIRDRADGEATRSTFQLIH
jgi:hypothetical protein